jgi:hypothetical protein
MVYDIAIEHGYSEMLTYLEKGDEIHSSAETPKAISDVLLSAI